NPDRPGAGVVAVEDASGGGEGGRGAAAPVGRQQRCSVLPAELEVPFDRADQADPGRTQEPVAEGAMVPGRRYVLECRYVDDGSRAYLGTFDYQPGVTGPDPEALARQVYEEVPLVFPTPHTSPPADAQQLVGFPVWLWVDGGVWRSFDASASLAGVTVTVVAQPQSLRWDMGDGTVLDCAGPGTAWTPDTPDSQRSDCSHVYQYVSARQSGGRYQASVTVSWSVTWSASTGQSGTLPVASRSSSFSLDVRERQAVITYGSR
ncbi:MAG: hypothetical protein ACRD2C_23040, partial [Acidimicrobiales bacterium]